MISPKSEKDRKNAEGYEDHISLNKMIQKIEEEKRNLENRVY